MFQAILSNFHFLTQAPALPTTTKNEVMADLAWYNLGPTIFFQTFFFNFFFNFFLFLIEIAPTRTKSHPNSKLFEQKCIIGDCYPVCGHVQNLKFHQIKNSKTKICFRPFWATLIFWTLSHLNEIIAHMAWYKFFFSFFFFAFLTKSVPTKTKSHPNSKLFEPNCIVGDSKQLTYYYVYLSVCICLSLSHCN